MIISEERILRAPINYSLFTICHTHGWTYLAPFSWDDNKNLLEFALSADGQAVDASVRQFRRSLEIRISSSWKMKSSRLKTIDVALNRILGLNEDISGLAETSDRIGQAQAGLIRRGAGRLLRGASLWEDAAKTLFTTNCSWALTKKMCEKVCLGYCSAPAPSGRYPFPPASALADERVDDLRRRIPIGYRAEALKQLAQSFSSNPGLDGLESKSIPYDEAYKKTVRLKGFGPYAVTHLLILAGYYDRIPVDSEVIGYIKKHYKCRSVEKFVYRHYSAWGRYKWWGLKFEKMLRRQNWLGD